MRSTSLIALLSFGIGLVACGGGDEGLVGGDPADIAEIDTSIPPGDTAPHADAANVDTSDDVSRDSTVLDSGSATPDAAATVDDVSAGDTNSPDSPADTTMSDSAGDTIAPDSAGDTSPPDSAGDTSPPDSAGDTSPPEDTMTSADTGSSADVGSDSVSDAATDAGTVSCTSTRGPSMVRVDLGGGSFCVDATEVSYSHYAAFVAATDKPSQPSFCAWNTNYGPTLAGTNNHPVVGVDWCDAYAFCSWAGKRLCGNIGGGPSSYTAYATATSSQWFAACSAAGTRDYPYGAVYSASACNGFDKSAGTGTVAVGSLPACQGGAPGIYDMSGNVWEWEDSCNGTSGATDTCRVRGGGYSSNSLRLRCDANSESGVLSSPPKRNDAAITIGFRCCR